MRILMGAAALALLCAAGLRYSSPVFDAAVRFLVTAGAIAMTMSLLRARRFVFASVFGAIAVLYNPVFPVWGLSGEWQRPAVAACALPFAVALGWWGHQRQHVPLAAPPLPGGTGVRN
jgi:hypothetical protein